MRNSIESGDGTAEFSDSEKTEYVEKLRSHSQTLRGYEAAVFDKINEYANALKLVDEAQEQNETKEKTDKLERDANGVYFELEDLDVTTQERFKTNPECWVEKVLKAKAYVDNSDTTSANWFSEESNLHHVHQTDLALKRDAVTTVSCVPLDLAPLYCPAIATGCNKAR